MARLNSLDKFNLIAGIIGLIADIVGLTSLIIAASKNSQAIQISDSQISTSQILIFSYIAMLFFFIIVFSFYAITVVLLTKYVPINNLYNSRVARPALFLGTLPYTAWCGYVVSQAGKFMDVMPVSGNIETLIIIGIIVMLILLYLPGMNFLITSAADLAHLILRRRNISAHESDTQNAEDTDNSSM